MLTLDFLFRLFRSDTFNPAGRPQAVEGTHNSYGMTTEKERKKSVTVINYSKEKKIVSEFSEPPTQTLDVCAGKIA